MRVPRLIHSVTGPPAEKVEYEASDHWMAPGEAEPNATEKLFFALALVYTAESVSELNSWAERVLVDRARAEELKESWNSKVEAAMARRIATGVADTVEQLNGPEPPPFDQALVGRRVEVLWRYTDMETGKPTLIWSPGTVKRVADGLSDKRSARARKVLPAGAVLWAWDADEEFEEKAGEQWLFLKRDDWNPLRQGKQYAWRFDMSEFEREREPEERVGARGANLFDE